MTIISLHSQWIHIMPIPVFLCQARILTTIAYVAPSPRWIVTQDASRNPSRPEEKKVPTLRSLDKRIQAPLPDFAGKLSFEEMRRRIGKATSVKIATTEVELTNNAIWAVLRNADTGDTMEAYALLYRMRWVRYRTGVPDYDLTTASDVADSLFLPQNEFQQQRFAAMNAFFKTLDDDARSSLFTGKPVPLASMPPDARAPLVEAVQALLDGTSANQPLASKPDLRNLADIVVSLRDDGKPSDGFHNMWVSIDSNIGSLSFRWNDYKKGQAPIGYARPPQYVHEPVSNEGFSRKEMIKNSPLCAKIVRIEDRERSLDEILRLLASQFHINILADITTTPPKIAAVDGLPFSKAMDTLCQVFGDLQWEILHDRFLVLRASDNPRRRP